MVSQNLKGVVYATSCLVSDYLNDWQWQLFFVFFSSLLFTSICAFLEPTMLQSPNCKPPMCSGNTWFNKFWGIHSFKTVLTVIPLIIAQYLPTHPLLFSHWLLYLHSFSPHSEKKKSLNVSGIILPPRVIVGQKGRVTVSIEGRRVDRVQTAWFLNDTPISDTSLTGRRSYIHPHNHQLLVNNSLTPLTWVSDHECVLCCHALFKLTEHYFELLLRSQILPDVSDCILEKHKIMHKTSVIFFVWCSDVALENMPYASLRH